MRPLPKACYWIDTPDLSILRYSFRVVGVVTQRSGEWRIEGYGKFPFSARVSSRERGRRYLGQWFAARMR